MKYLGAAFIIFVLCFTIAKTETRYSMEGEIVERNENIITIEDSRGHLWDEMQDGNEFSIGDSVVITFDNNHTVYIPDDTIISIRHIQ